MHPATLGLFCFGFDGLTAPPHLCRRLEAGLGGVILFRRNLHDLDQIGRLTASLGACAPAPLLIGVDQEGGRVVRLPPPFLQLPSAGQLGRLDDPERVRRLSRAVGVELRAAGITWNLAPVLDVHTHPANPVIGDRSFGPDPDRVGRLGVAAIEGFRAAGILATGKHFPGHGDTAVDSHQALPESLQSAARWREVEFSPFRRAVAAGVPSILVAHLACPALDPVAPSSLSRRIIEGILREELGFAEAVVSDDLEMGAITEGIGVGEAAVRFLEAGGDLLLVCRRVDRQEEALAAVDRALCSGRISAPRLEGSLRRIARLRAGLGALPPPSEAARRLIGSAAHQALLCDVQEAIANAGSTGLT